MWRSVIGACGRGTRRVERRAKRSASARSLTTVTWVASPWLPSGIVTFVFTDIEGSTRLFRRIGDRYPSLLQRHREILRAAWVAYGGFELATEGDSFFVAFAETADAIEACAKGQRDLTAEGWPVDAPIRVRMGVHSGLAVPRGDNDVAFVVHQAARVVSAGHGGQVVVSADAVARVTSLGGVALRSLGRYRVRDFEEPIELFQLAGSGLPEGFPALRVLPADRHNLVAPISSLVGRDNDIVELAGLIADHRLVSVVGPGGLGKTRLVVEYGMAHASRWDDGIWFVDLASVGDPSGIAQAVAGAVGAPIADRSDAWVAVVDHLRDRTTVVIMDNCEHLAPGASAYIEALLRSCPAVKVVTTTREPLGLRAERIWRPGRLASDTTAVELFCQRAGLDQPDSGTRAAVAELCERVDGLPLAIELAAARADVLSPAEILARLDRHNGLLRSPDPTLGARQRSVEDLIDWSYQLLTASEQLAFCRLAVFAAGFSGEAAEAAVSDEHVDRYDVPELVWSLQSKSLVTSDPGAGATRYRMLETTRAFAARRLAQIDEMGDTAARAGRYYMSIFGPALRKLDPSAVSDRGREIDNLRHLVTVLSSHDADLAQTIASTIVQQRALTTMDGALEEGLDHLERLPIATPSRARLLLSCARAAAVSGRTDQASELINDAEATAAIVGLPIDADGTIEFGRGLIAIHRADFGAAHAMALAGLQRATTPSGRSLMFNVLSIASLNMGLNREAREADERCLEIRTEMGDLFGRSVALSNLAEAALRDGEVIGAARYQLSSLTLALQLGARFFVASAIVVAARLAATTHDWATATRLQAAADTALTAAGAMLVVSDRALCDELIADARSQLDEHDYQTELKAGQQLSVELAVLQTQHVLTTMASLET